MRIQQAACSKQSSSATENSSVAAAARLQPLVALRIQIVGIHLAAQLCRRHCKRPNTCHDISNNIAALEVSADKPLVLVLKAGVPEDCREVEAEAVAVLAHLRDEVWFACTLSPTTVHKQLSRHMGTAVPCSAACERLRMPVAGARGAHQQHAHLGCDGQHLRTQRIIVAVICRARETSRPENEQDVGAMAQTRDAQCEGHTCNHLHGKHSELVVYLAALVYCGLDCSILVNADLHR